MTPPVTLSEELDQVAQSRSGEAFVYEALARLALRHQLSDAVVVLPEVDGGPARVLRLDRRPLAPSMLHRLASHPGLHCDPPRIPREERRLVLERCRAALAPEPPSAPAPEPVAPLPPAGPPVGPALGVRAPGTVELEVEAAPPGGPSATPTTFRALVRGPLGARRRRAPGPLPGDDVRLRVSVGLVAVSLAIVALGLAQVHGPVRFVVGLVFGLLGPGWAVVGWMRLAQPALELGMTLAASLTILMLSAQVLITVHLWHLMGFGEVLGLVCAVSLTLQARQHRRRGVR
ncbi:MAG: hypothetical protein B7Z69_00275 [Actinobacteria bacterium 21-73-9]|nr:MAG: hypothetical protein B7Z69_00275 [Actinobacteria bacterium 21-73-9]